MVKELMIESLELNIKDRFSKIKSCLVELDEGADEWGCDEDKDYDKCLRNQKYSSYNRSILEITEQLDKILNILSLWNRFENEEE